MGRLGPGDPPNAQHSAPAPRRAAWHRRWGQWRAGPSWWPPLPPSPPLTAGLRLPHSGEGEPAPDHWRSRADRCVQPPTAPESRGAGRPISQAEWRHLAATAPTPVAVRLRLCRRGQARHEAQWRRWPVGGLRGLRDKVARHNGGEVNAARRPARAIACGGHEPLAHRASAVSACTMSASTNAAVVSAPRGGACRPWCAGRWGGCGGAASADSVEPTGEGVPPPTPPSPYKGGGESGGGVGPSGMWRSAAAAPPCNKSAASNRSFELSGVPEPANRASEKVYASCEAGDGPGVAIPCGKGSEPQTLDTQCVCGRVRGRKRVCVAVGAWRRVRGGRSCGPGRGCATTAAAAPHSRLAADRCTVAPCPQRVRLPAAAVVGPPVSPVAVLRVAPSGARACAGGSRLVYRADGDRQHPVECR